VLKGVEAAISRGDFPVGGVGKASRWGAGCVWSTEIEMHLSLGKQRRRKEAVGKTVRGSFYVVYRVIELGEVDVMPLLFFIALT